MQVLTPEIPVKAFDREDRQSRVFNRKGNRRLLLCRVHVVYDGIYCPMMQIYIPSRFAYSPFTVGSVSLPMKSIRPHVFSLIMKRKG